MIRAVIAAAILSIATTPASAQDVQRCETADGKISYANGPCPPGTRAVRTLPPANAPSAADRQAAQQRAKQDAGKLAVIERDQKAQEARAAREQERAENATKKKEAHCRRLATRLRHAQEDLANAPLKKRTEAQRRVKRADELHAEDCGPKPK